MDLGRFHLLKVSIRPSQSERERFWTLALLRVVQPTLLAHVGGSWTLDLLRSPAERSLQAREKRHENHVNHSEVIFYVNRSARASVYNAIDGPVPCVIAPLRLGWPS